mmetsp:Transcript_8935/g.54950  ORF Transcript_8935/g.54950 Transcript_8935/m.54950 type:complete len:200 (-) Transcript_8935:461-1060(-)
MPTQRIGCDKSRTHKRTVFHGGAVTPGRSPHGPGDTSHLLSQFLPISQGRAPGEMQCTCHLFPLLLQPNPGLQNLWIHLECHLYQHGTLGPTRTRQLHLLRGEPALSVVPSMYCDLWMNNSRALDRNRSESPLEGENVFRMDISLLLWGPSGAESRDSNANTSHQFLDCHTKDKRKHGQGESCRSACIYSLVGNKVEQD